MEKYDVRLTKEEFEKIRSPQAMLVYIAFKRYARPFRRRRGKFIPYGELVERVFGSKDVDLAVKLWPGVRELVGAGLMKLAKARVRYGKEQIRREFYPYEAHLDIFELHLVSADTILVFVGDPYEAYQVPITGEDDQGVEASLPGT